MTFDEAKAFLAIPNKVVVRSVSWDTEQSGHLPYRRLFKSAVMANGKVLEGVRFEAIYRPPKTIVKGGAQIDVGASLTVQLFAKNSLRIAALDTKPNHRHHNRVGMGQPHYGKIITTDTHLHVWVGEPGYVEPIEPAIFDMQKMFECFSKCCNLSFLGEFVEPRKGEQGVLPL